MKDFLDVLFDEIHQTRSVREASSYLQSLRSLLADIPARRPLLQNSSSSWPLLAETIKNQPTQEYFQTQALPSLFFFEVRPGAAEPSWIRKAKQLDVSRPMARWDTLKSEAQVLETIAMGADLYCLAPAEHDAITLQYLIEIGVDFDVPVLLRCVSEEDLARAVFVEPSCILGLEGALAAPQLLSLGLLKNRKVVFSSDCDTALNELPEDHELKQIYFHWYQQKDACL